MGQTGETPATTRPDVGLCAACRHGTSMQSAKGSEFWRCYLSDSDARFLRYPPLPVERCPGFAPREC